MGLGNPPTFRDNPKLDLSLPQLQQDGIGLIGPLLNWTEPIAQLYNDSTVERSESSLEVNSCEVILVKEGSVIVEAHLMLNEVNSTSVNYGEAENLLEAIKRGLAQIPDDEVKSLGVFLDPDMTQVESGEHNCRNYANL
ncbi:hypothetical protein Ciccas_003341 [Cichlidogyrus casuarinus]|uniref:Uncharacterized protein n=1 Tax=Cichlidogyrus casuarinus TaxID=1844966 RepID=A0ABD2QEP5_9PLAT